MSILNVKATILYVEDDDSLSFVTGDNLEREGYKVIFCHDGEEALQVIKSAEIHYDLAILDVMLPKVDGYALATEIRRFNKEVPIMFISAKSLKEDKIHGLKIGADDYITKPFSMEEVTLKIEMFLRRSKKLEMPSPDVYHIGIYVFDFPSLKLFLNGEARNLTQKEADLMHMFILNKGQIVKRADILEKYWGKNDYFLGRSLDVFVSRLRKYFSDDPNIEIENVHAVGFRFEVR